MNRCLTKNAQLVSRLTVALGMMAACLLLFAGHASAQVYRFGNMEETGSNQQTPLIISGLPETPTVVDASNASTCALEPNGTVYAWGYNANGELGNGNSTPSLNAAVQVKFPAGVIIKAIGEGRRSCFAIDTTGKGWAWGEGGDDMFCNGHENAHLPVEVPVTGAAQVQSGSRHALWLLETGTVLGCGENRYGQLGLPKSIKNVRTPTAVPGPTNVVEISAGWGSSLERTAEGTVYGYGNNGTGRICQSKKTKRVYGATLIKLPEAATEISAGGDVAEDGASLFMTAGGVVYGCGFDREGQIGDGKTANKYAPVVASELTGLGLVQVVTGGIASEGVTATGQVYTWGSAMYGDLGNGTEVGYSLTPVMIADGTSAKVSVTATAHNLLFWEGS